MAAGALARPGTKYGPCVERCTHRDCAASREMATACCPECGEEIGYERRFFHCPDAPGYIHEVCLEDRVERERVAAE